MTKRIFRAITLVAISVLIVSLIVIMGFLYSYFTTVQQKQLRMQTELAAQGVEGTGMAYFENLNVQDYRLTWIDADGVVLFDSEADAADLENHNDREEIQEAYEKGYGDSDRYSDTLMEHYYYCAKRLDDGSVVRLSIAQSTVLVLLLGMSQPIGLVILVTIILSLLLASRLSKKIVEPFNELNLDEPLSNEGYDELAPMLRRIDSQQKQLKLQALELKHKKEELEAVTSNMNEGLVLLNHKGKIISMNPAAIRILEAGANAVGQDFVTINRDLKMKKELEKAQDGQCGELVLALADGVYQIDISPVITEDTVSGVAMLLFDITEKEKIEQLRREFTANVSHELKTPLHSISGYAELMLNGMVKEQDIPIFSNRIYTEAQRMIHLVADIIHLSRLDEGVGDMAMEQVNLYEVAKSVVARFAPGVEQTGVTLKLQGEDTYVSGIRPLIQGIIFNLCDNAIKYNKQGGTVDVLISSGEACDCITVKDTGIGISPEHQDRIFERFYRVDKSHSKEVGGTGLGLSIVKHSVMIHNAKIEIDSAEGEGTTIKICFPK